MLMATARWATKSTLMATARRATGYDDDGDDKDNEVDGDGASGDGVMGNYGYDHVYGDGRWMTTTMATA